MRFITYLSLALAISLLTVGFAVGLPTENHNHEATQATQQAQQLNATGAKESEKGPTSKARYLGGVGGYEVPVLSGGYETPIAQPYIQQQGYGYQQPSQSYGAPIQQGYGSSYQQPIVSSYQQPIVSSYQQPIVSTYEQPIQQTYQQPIVSSYSNYSAPVTSSYGSSYQQPIVQSYQQQSYQQPIVSNYTQSYQQPYQQSYQQPYQQSYQQPIQQSYQQPIQQSYQQPIVSNYSTPVYTPQVSTYSAPVQTYEQPIVQSYQQPIVQSYQQQSYQQPIVQSYQQQSYQQPIQQSYQQQSYQQPIQQSYQQQSYQQPIVSNYTQSYQQPIVSTYQQPIVEQPYVAPVQSYGTQQTYQQPIVQSYQQPYQQSYQQPIVQSYQQPYQQPYQQSYQQQSYQQPIVSSYGQGIYSKRQLNSTDAGGDGNSLSAFDVIEAKSASASPSSSSSPVELSSIEEASTSTGAASNDEMSTSESNQSVNFVSRPQNIKSVVSATTSPVSYVSQPVVQYPTFSNNLQSTTSRYLDIQPEFTQSWADFYQPPGYLPVVFRNNYNQFLQQQPSINRYQTGLGYGGAVNLQYIGLGYITSYGPINPAIFYVPVRAQYYYRVPLASPYYFLRQGYYNGRAQYTPQITTNQVTTTSTYKGGYGGVGGGVLKRSLNNHENPGAPYSMLVDHLAAAATETFTNVSGIECPPQPSAYTCPQMLNLSKEELKKKICDYENVLTGIVSLVPDTEKAQTRCGAMKIIKSDGKSAVADLPEKMAIVLGKNCQLKTIMDNNAQQATKDQVYVLTKTAMPPGTKFILANGSDVDMLSSQAIPNEEISALLKQCPAKVKSQ